MFTTHFGTPAAMYASISFTALNGDADDGLKTTVLPAIIAALVGPAARAIGKLNGLTTPNTPWGRRIERVCTAASPRLSSGWS